MIKELLNRIKLNSDGHVPCIVQDSKTRRVLTLCYMTKEALEKTCKERFVYVFRRSLNRLMMKGETSGHTQKVKKVSLDCEGKSILIEVEQKVAACHKGYFSCYFEEFNKDGGFETGEKKVFDPDKVY